MIIDDNILSKFSKKIKYNLGNYLDAYTDFYLEDYPQIIKFFSGDIQTISSDRFLVLKNLMKESNLIGTKINTFSDLLRTFDDWEMVDHLDNLKNELFVVSKAYKFLRSSRTDYTFSGTYEFNYTMGVGENLEEVSNKVLLSEKYDNDWVAIAMKNQLSELDYDLSGGNKLILSINITSGQTFNINSIIDVIKGKSIYGKDIQQKIEFVDNDMKALGYDDTLNQSINILVNLEKGDIPEFRGLGRGKLIGKSIKSVALPSVIRQLVEVFSSDDSLANFKVLELKIDGDSVFVEFSISTVLELIPNKTFSI